MHFCKKTSLKKKIKHAPHRRKSTRGGGSGGVGGVKWSGLRPLLQLQTREHWGSAVFRQSVKGIVLGNANKTNLQYNLNRKPKKVNFRDSKSAQDHQKEAPCSADSHGPCRPSHRGGWDGEGGVRSSEAAAGDHKLGVKRG